MKHYILLTLSLIVLSANGQTYKKPLVSAIEEENLKTDMYAFASNQFLGREAGTLDEFKVMWFANKVEDAGMKPAGDDGTYFQFFDIYRHLVVPQSSLKLGDQPLTIWKDFLVSEPVNAEIESEVIYAGDAEPEDLEKFDLKDKILAVNASDKNISKDMALFIKLYPDFVRAKYYDTAMNLGAKGIIFITDETSEKSWEEGWQQMSRGFYGNDGLKDKITNNIPIVWIKKENVDWVKNNPKISLNIVTESYKYPSVNIVGKIEGTDPVLKNEYILISGHQDHGEVIRTMKNDSIYNGVDNNTSTCIAMLTMAKAYKAQPSKRSILFVFHGAEEKGLLGAKWSAAHPAVPKKNIVAVLNSDMIGRNATDNAIVIEKNALQKNTDELVKMTEEDNNENIKFTYLKNWGTSTEKPEYFYFRSDYLPYAKEGIPTVFFTSILNDQYYRPNNDSENVSFKKLYEMTEWMYKTSWKIANEKNRPTIFKNFSLDK